METKRIQDSLLKTLSFFDGFSMPLNKQELKRFYYGTQEGVLWQDIETVLAGLVQWGAVKQFDDLYCLPDREQAFCLQRKERKIRAISLMENARLWLKMISLFPGVQAVAICNNLAFLNATDNSDIDLFIITKPGKIWQTRFFLASFMQVFKKRPTKASNYGKFCLSFFVTSDNLDLTPVIHEDDPYFSYWFASLLPVYDPQSLLPRFMEINKPHWRHIGIMKPVASRERQEKQNRSSAVLETVTDPFAPILEKKTKSFQQKRFPLPIREKLTQNQTDVVVSDTMLKFHTKDRRIYYRDLWNKKNSKLLSSKS